MNWITNNVKLNASPVHYSTNVKSKKAIGMLYSSTWCHLFWANLEKVETILSHHVLLTIHILNMLIVLGLRNTPMLAVTLGTEIS